MLFTNVGYTGQNYFCRVYFFNVLVLFSLKCSLQHTCVYVYMHLHSPQAERKRNEGPRNEVKDSTPPTGKGEGRVGRQTHKVVL
jgi:hypothetical protein